MEDMQELLQKRNVACREGPGVKRVSNLVYTISDNVEYRCDIYLPDENPEKKRHPVVFLVHGEAPAQGLKDSGAYVSLGELIASSGMAAVTFDHRMLLSGTSVSGILDDIMNVRDFVFSHAADYDIDTSRTCIWTISAGLPFGLHNALHHRSDDIRCVVTYYGFGDFETLISVLQGASDTAGAVPEIFTGPVGFPILVIRSGLDHVVINNSLDGFIRRCLEVNTDIDVYNHATGNHAFDILDDNKRSHELIDATMVFMQKHLLL